MIPNNGHQMTYTPFQLGVAIATLPATLNHPLNRFASDPCFDEVVAGYMSCPFNGSSAPPLNWVQNIKPDQWVTILRHAHPTHLPGLMHPLAAHPSPGRLLDDVCHQLETSLPKLKDPPLLLTKLQALAGFDSMVSSYLNSVEGTAFLLAEPTDPVARPILWMVICYYLSQQSNPLPLPDNPSPLPPYPANPDDPNASAATTRTSSPVSPRPAFTPSPPAAAAAQTAAAQAAAPRAAAQTATPRPASPPAAAAPAASSQATLAAAAQAASPRATPATPAASPQSASPPPAPLARAQLAAAAAASPRATLAAVARSVTPDPAATPSDDTGYITHNRKTVQTLHGTAPEQVTCEGYGHLENLDFFNAFTHYSQDHKNALTQWPYLTITTPDGRQSKWVIDSSTSITKGWVPLRHLDSTHPHTLWARVSTPPHSTDSGTSAPHFLNTWLRHLHGLGDDPVPHYEVPVMGPTPVNR
ncbi:hypothetical protein EBZ35_07310 [bacterium]|nr:hypothetical protein [bacterium]